MMDDWHLKAVSETLFIPLYALALESQTERPILMDPAAVALTEKLNQAFGNSDWRIFKRLAQGRLPRALITALALRMRRFDQYIRDFLHREPGGIVVNLGCGLDNRRGRLDEGQMRWYDLDLPEVIALRRSFLEETERFRFIASSVLDFTYTLTTAVRPPVKSRSNWERWPDPRRIIRFTAVPIQLTTSSTGWMAYSPKERPPAHATMCRIFFFPTVCTWSCTFVYRNAEDVCTGTRKRSASA